MKLCRLSSVHSADDIRIGRIRVRTIEPGLAGPAAVGRDYDCERETVELKNFYCGIIL